MWNANRLARRSLLALAIPAVASVRPSLQRFEAVEPHMGTLVGITLYATSQSQAAKAFRTAFAKIAEVNQALSNYLPTSEANQLSTQWRSCSAHLRATLQLALLLQTKTDGAFDITLAPLLDLWRQVRKGQRPWPTPEEVKALRPTGTVEINARGQARLTDARVRLDFGALGKGYAADIALAELGRLGIRSALVACSGDIVVSAPPPSQPGWQVAAAGQPRTLRNAAVSTSGDSSQFVEHDGKRFSHILDGRTGFPVESHAAVSAVGPKGLQADAAATVGYILGLARAAELFPQVRLTGDSTTVR